MGVSVAMLSLDNRRTRHVATLLALLCCLSVVDLYFTIWAHRFTPFFELNPMARRLLSHSNVAGLIFMKLALTALSGTIFWSLRRRGSVEAALWMLFIVHMLLMMRWSHYVSDIAEAPDQNHGIVQIAGL